MGAVKVGKFDDLMAEARQRPFEGWDHSYGGRIVTEEPWDFGTLVDAMAAVSPDLLDMGTGGGEWLSARRLPGRVVATEGWAPNVPVAKARLSPLGIEVIAVDGAPENIEQEEGAEEGELPFPDGSFHLVVNRHESYVASEVLRILTPGGCFVTQQVASTIARDFHRLLGETSPPIAKAWDLDFAIRQIIEAGFAIEEQAQGAQLMRFADVGAFAWYLKSLPFIVPDFSIDRAWAQLARLHDATGEKGIEVRQPIFRLTARKSMA
ncbi:class I SAM-dependent methyltransferase [Nordella sp. HKS 07]|uniref:class I SAM-dependent methyltransferase n=1 Tax=Nordella sp. HKS 07 TaxID=2712222 RepID=UPI0019CFC75D|nr:methyltransferase domain-containing protein [Nordella sp. HKS 07]